MHRKLRLLAWMDSPLSITGFGVVAKNLLGRIYNTGAFDVACVGINYFEEHFERAFEPRNEVPYKVFIGQDIIRGGNNTIQATDPMGRAKAIQMVRGGHLDVLFMMRDLWDMAVKQLPGRPWLESYFPLHLQLAKENGNNFRVMGHFPLEYQLQQDWVDVLDMFDYGYCFTAGGMGQLDRWNEKISWCPQGADTATFKPLDTFNKNDFKHHKMRLDPNTFVVLNVNRNQPRKDIESTIQAFAKFKTLIKSNSKKRPVLWLHMRPDDNFGDARQIVNKYNLKVDQDVCFPPFFNVGTGWSDQELNMLYNTADIYVSTSVAEGFGLTPVEAGCAGLPTLVPGHTGFLQTMHVLGMPYIKTKAPEVRQNVAPSPVHPTDVDDMAQQLASFYDDPSALQRAITMNLGKFRDTFSWDNIFKKYWEPMLEVIQEDILGTKKRQENNSKRFLFVCEEAAGDISAGASPAIAGLKSKYPHTPIDFMCKSRFQSILKGMPQIDKILPWDINKIYDYPKERVFYPHAKIRHGAWANGPYHLMDMQAQMIGVMPGEPYIYKEEFDLLLDDMDGKVPQIITVHTTSQGGKMITPQKWADLIVNVLKHFPAIRFAVIGGPGDMMVPGALDFRGLSWERQAYLQSKAFCHVGIDSSAAHFASIVGQPSIVFWGWTNANVCKPRRFGINISAHYPTVCPKLGPCHGVQPTCNINQYDTRSAMTAPCVQSIDVRPAVELLCTALEKGYEEGREWLKEYSKNQALIYGIPNIRQTEDQEVKLPKNKLEMAGVK